MRILFALPYGPGPTRVRSRMLLEQLAARHRITLLTLCRTDEDWDATQSWAQRGVTVRGIAHGRYEQLRALVGDPDRPLQQIAATAPAFAREARSELAHAADSGAPFDVLHVEHLRGAVAVDLPRPLGVFTVFDAVDCLAELARVTAAHNPHPVYRLIARHEQQRTERLERRLLEASDLVTVAAERDRRALLRGGKPGRIVTIPNGVALRSEPVRLTSAPRAVFTGKLSYHANQAAARWLLEHIWPRVRAMVPHAELTIAGAEPPAWLRRDCRSARVELCANPRDMSAIVAEARVALAPVPYSVGIQNKVLEAMALGVPVAGTSSAAAGLDGVSAGAMAVADDPGELAALIARLLGDETAACRLGYAGYEYVRRRNTWADVARRFEQLYHGAYARAEAA